MKVIVTCGPSYEPVDEVRRITNFSTGELGVLLSTAFAGAGFETICLRGVAATYPGEPTGASVVQFTTNNVLAEPGTKTAKSRACPFAPAACRS